MTDVAKTDWRYLTEQARKLEAERDDFKALVQRVHAELNPKETKYIEFQGFVQYCLWRTADELLRKVGEV